jgi:hypothetical protein
MKKILTEGNQIHNFILCVCEKFCVPFQLFDMLLQVPVPQGKKLRFLRIRFHTTGFGSTYAVWRIQDVNPGSDFFSIPDPESNFFFILDPGSSKNLSILTQKNGF